jgi:hypothetical protein
MQDVAPDTQRSSKSFWCCFSKTIMHKKVRLSAFLCV